MRPRLLKVGELIFWFHSYDALNENRASVHVGKGSQDDVNDAKIWLQPRIEIAREGRTLKKHEIKRAVDLVSENHNYLLEQWHAYTSR